MKRSDKEQSFHPDDVVYLLDIAKLQLGDVILTSSPGFAESFFIRKVTHGDFSHALLIVQPPNAMESANTGVVRFRVDPLCVVNRNNIALRRVKPEHPFNAEALIKAAGSLMGVPYAMIGALASIVPFIPEVERGNVFCSQLVAKCFLDAGLEICPGIPPSKTTPAAMARSPIFQPVENTEFLVEERVGSLPFVPRRFDAPNQPTPSEELTSESQDAFMVARQKFEAYGLDVFSREQAIIEVQKALLRNEPYAQELDMALAEVYRRISISEVMRRCFPADSLDNFIDLMFGRAILSGRLSKENAVRLRHYHQRNLEIAKQTIAERESFVLAERSAYFRTGSEANRLHLAGEMEMLALHKNWYEVTSRAVKVLGLFLQHEGDPIELELAFVTHLFPGLNALLAQHFGKR